MFASVVTCTMSPNGPALDLCIGCRDLGRATRPNGSGALSDLKSPPVADKNAPAIPHSDAFDCVFSMTSESAEDALAFIFVALEHAVTAKQEAYLAAGALEHLLKRHGVLMIDRVLAAARRDPKFRRCLAGVWGHSGMDKSVRERTETCPAPMPGRARTTRSKPR